MKTIRFQLLLLALFVMVGCQKDEMSTSMKKGSYSLVASIENNDSTSRTAVDENGGVTWVATDAIGVFGTQTKNAKFESTGAGANVTFVGDLESSHEEPTLAYYPYNENASLDGNALSFTLPSEYSYTGQCYAPMLGIKQADGNFVFKHLVGLLKVTVKNMPENAKRLFVVSEGTEEKAAPAITGDVLVNDVTANNATLSITENKGHEVSIDLKNTSAQETYTFFIPIPVGEYPKLSVKLEMNDGVIYMDKSVSNVNMVRAMMLDMPVIDAEKEETGITAIVRGTVDIENPEGLKIESLIDDSELTEDGFTVEVFSNGLPQFIHVMNDKGNILMMAQSYPLEGEVQVNARSTALSLVSILLSSFGCQSKDDFTEQRNMIESSSYFDTLVNEVQKSIDLENDVMDINNTSLISALSDLVNDLLSGGVNTRAYYGDEIQGMNGVILDVRTLKGPSKEVTIRNTNLNPAYECFVYDNTGVEISSQIIPSPGSVGLWDIFNNWLSSGSPMKEIDNMLGFKVPDFKVPHYGEPTYIKFSEVGKYRLQFRKNTEKAEIFTGLQLFSDYMSILGFVPNIRTMGKDFFDNKNVLKEGALGSCLTSIISIVSSTISGSISVDKARDNIFMAFERLAYDIATVSYDFWYQYFGVISSIKYDDDGFVDEITFEEKWKFSESSFSSFCKKITLAMALYDVLKAAKNLSWRIKSMITAPSFIDFGLEYNNEPWDKIICWTDTKLNILAGNEQVGIKGEQLPKPLMVAVETISDDGNDYWNEDWHDRLKVKFEVVTEDGGFVKPELVSPDYISRIASTNWFLGNSGEQKIRAVVVDAYTQLERSEPVYFTASFEGEEEEGTITTTEATNKTQTTATLSGNIQGYEADDFGHRYGIIYSTDANPTASNGTIAVSNNIQEDGNYSVDVTSLTENTSYYYRAFVRNHGDYVYADNVLNFTTLKPVEDNEGMTEREILIAFYNATDGDNWKNNENWCSDKPLGEWYGVRTDDPDGHVTSISLGGELIVETKESRKFGLKGDANLSNLSKLESIFLDHNQLSSLNVNNCKSLTSIFCDYNELKNSDVSMNGCSNLENVNLEHNQLKYLDFSSFENLLYINCRYNVLENINVRNNIQLQSLTVNNNNLTSLDVSGCENLGSLSVFDNRLTSLDVSNNKLLYALACYRNQLTSLNVTGCNELQTIDCHGNQITAIDLKGKTQLTRLICDNNKLSSIDVTGLSQIKSFSCTNNELTKLDISDLVKIREFSCKGNKLTSLDVSKCTGMVGALDCSDNLLTEIKIPDCLSYLTCSNNNFVELDFSGYTNLKQITCLGEVLKVFKAVGCTSLSYVRLENKADVDVFNLTGCTNLISVWVGETQIKEVYLPASMSKFKGNFDEWGDWIESEGRYQYPKFYWK